MRSSHRQRPSRSRSRFDDDYVDTPEPRHPFGERHSAPDRSAVAAAPFVPPASFTQGIPSETVVVQWFNATKGFGFVKRASGPDVFLHISQLEATGHKAVAAGTTLVVKLSQGNRGLQVAVVESVDTSTATEEAPRAPRVDSPRPDSAYTGRPSAAAETTEDSGTVKWFNVTKGFGFVSSDSGGKDIFLHASALQRSGLVQVPEGQKVRMRITQGERGPQVDTLSVD